MTTPSTARKAGPFTGNGTQNSWPFTFKVFAASDIKVTIADTTGAETVLTLGTDYTVTLNSNQDTSPGGSVTYLLSNAYKLTVTGDLDYDQPLDIPGGGNFNPVAFENQLDRTTMQIQQLAEQMVRAVKVPVTDDGTGELSGDLAQGILALGPVADDIATVAGDIAAVQDVSTNMTAVSAVGGNIAEVSAVGGSIANVNTVAGNTANIDAVAANTTQITQVAAVDDEVAVVAGVASDVTTVAGIAADIPTVAENLADITNFADVYQGPKLADPTLRNDGSALQVGDLYFNTAVERLRAYGTAGWGDASSAAPITITPQAFSGNGSTTAFTLSVAPAFPAALDVYVSGVHQELTADYTVSGTTLTFVTAPPSGTNNVTVKILSAYAVGVPENGSVTTPKLADNAVTADKIAEGAVGTSEIADGAVGTNEIADGAVGTSELANAAVTTEKIADAAVTPAKLANSGYELGMRNRIINGSMVIDQRYGGTAHTVSPGPAGYVVDRWRFAAGSSWAVQQVSLNANGFRKAVRLTSALNSAGIAQLQRIESANIADLAYSASTVTLSFYAKAATAVGGAGVQINYANSADNFTSVTGLTSTTVSMTTSLTKYTFSFALTSACATGLEVLINWPGGVNAFDITGVQLESGSTATPFEFRPYGTELALCQRYFQLAPQMLGVAITTTSSDQVVAFPVQMRVGPTFVQPWSSVDLRVNGNTSNIGVTLSAVSTTPNSSVVQLTRTTGTWTAGNVVAVSEQAACTFNSEL